MALALADYASIAALVSAACDAVSLGKGTFEELYRRYLSAPDAAARGTILHSTYTDEELESIRDRIQHCNRQFAETGDGNGRKRCLCFVLRQAELGDGGFPLPEWEAAYGRLKCAN